jgi:uncharacterized glyoxalase superfamily protein PhnB
MTLDQDPPALGEYDGHEIYPMPAFATISVTDVARVAAWYEQALGFATVFRAPDVEGQPSLVHLRRRKYQDLLLTPARVAVPSTVAPSSLTLSFNADGEVDALAERARAVEPLGRSSIMGPIDTPWNTRDVRVTDPAGHRLVFTGRNPNADTAQLGRMRELLDRQRVTRG